MMRLACVLTMLAGPALADFDCRLSDQACVADCPVISVMFDVDAGQFANPQSPDDPPRRQVTTVTMDGATFVAQAIMMQGGVRGFHEDAGELGSRLMIVQRDGAARLVTQPRNIVYTGQCITN